MPIESKAVKDLDYFDCLRLDGHRAHYVRSGKEGHISSDVIRLTLNVEGVVGMDLDKDEAAALTPELLRKNSIPLPENLDIKGRFKFVNMEDTYWLFVFMAMPNFVHIIKGAAFDKTLDAM
ncbi:hypothetical protein H8U31_001283 [Salmonella enterica]|nr:hypothetical protein [Salmonella enterica]